MGHRVRKDSKTMKQIRQYNSDDKVMPVRTHEDCIGLLQLFIAESSHAKTIDWAKRMLASDCDYFELADGEYLQWDEVPAKPDDEGNADLLCGLCQAIIHSTEMSRSEIIGYMVAIANAHDRSRIAHLPLKAQLALFRKIITVERPNG